MKYFFVVERCSKQDVPKLLGAVKRQYLHTFSHGDRTMIHVTTDDEQIAIIVHQCMSNYARVGALKEVGGRLVQRREGVAPVFAEKRSHPDRLRIPPKPENYKPFRMSDMPWYADLIKGR